MNVLLIDKDAKRLAGIASTLRDQGHQVSLFSGVMGPVMAQKMSEHDAVAAHIDAVSYGSGLHRSCLPALLLAEVFINSRILLYGVRGDMSPGGWVQLFELMKKFAPSIDLVQAWDWPDVCESTLANLLVEKDCRG